MTAEQLIIRRATEFSNPSGDEPAKELGLAARPRSWVWLLVGSSMRASVIWRSGRVWPLSSPPAIRSRRRGSGTEAQR